MDGQLRAEQLYGTWRLVSTSELDAEGRPLAAPYGPNPMGRAVFGADGRMMAVICDARPSLPEGETREFVAYSGNYELRDGVVTTTVDAASWPEGLHTTQVRKAAFRDGLLVLNPPPLAAGGRRELCWERCSSP